MAHRNDLHTARRLCEALNGLHLEDALTHVTVALQVKTARAFGVDIKGKSPATERFADAFAKAVARYAVEIVAEDEAAKAPN